MTLKDAALRRAYDFQTVHINNYGKYRTIILSLQATGFKIWDWDFEGTPLIISYLIEAQRTIDFILSKGIKI